MLVLVEVLELMKLSTIYVCWTIIKIYIASIKKSYAGKKLTGEIQHQFMSYVKLNKMFGWKPHTEIKEGLRSTYKWYNGFLKKYNYKDFL